MVVKAKYLIYIKKYRQNRSTDSLLKSNTFTTEEDTSIQIKYLLPVVT